MSSNRVPGVSTAPLVIDASTDVFVRGRGVVPGPIGANSTARGEDGSAQSASCLPWWEILDAGPDFPNTGIPLYFTLRVHAWTFHVKPNATEHLAEKAAASANSKTTFARDKVAQGTPRDERMVTPALPYRVMPITALAAAIETVMKRGLLDGIIASRSGTIGSPESPLQVGDWELAFEFARGRIELYHANYRPESTKAQKAGS